MQLISGVTLPEALPNNQINIYYIKNLALVKVNNGSLQNTWYSFCHNFLSMKMYSAHTHYGYLNMKMVKECILNKALYSDTTSMQS